MKIIETSHQTLTTQFGMSEQLWYQIHHYFNLSIYSGMRDLFQIKEEDVHTKPADEPSPQVVNVEESFTVVERQVIFFYIQFHYQMISQQQYMHSIESLGFSIETVGELIESKMTQLETMEATFKAGVTHSIEANLVKIQGFTEEMYGEVFSML